MSFDDLPAQPPLEPPEAEHYARRALELSRAAAASCDVVSDLAYGPHPAQRLDIYRPSDGTADLLPVLVFAHGGAWTNGYKEWLGLLGPPVTAFPAVLVAVSYRLAPEHRYPAPFDDCVAALTWVHAHIGEHGGDAGRIYVGGHSSGGTLFALVTLRRAALAAAGLPEGVIRGCLPLSARFDLRFDAPAPGSMEARHRSMIFEPGTEMERFSPLHNTEGNRTPFLIAHGSEDIPALCAGSAELRNALVRDGAHVEHLVLHGYDHFDTALRIADGADPWVRTVRDWMTEPRPQAQHQHPTNGVTAVSTQTSDRGVLPRPVMTAHVDGMTDVERLLAIEEIKQLKARYFRCMDTKDWDGFEAVFAPDVEFDLSEGIVARDPHTGEMMKSGDIQFTDDQVRKEEWTVSGARNTRDWEQGILEHWTTIHHGHCPEIEILTPTTARGIWHMEDRLRVPLKNAYEEMWWLPAPTRAHELQGYGVYHETYERIDGRWLIKTLQLKRIRVDIT